MEKHPILNARKEEKRSHGNWARSVTTAGVLGSAAALGLMAKKGYDYNGQFNHSQDSLENNINDDKKYIEDEATITEGDTLAVSEKEYSEGVEAIAEDLPSPIYEKVLDARIIEASGLMRDQVLFVDSLGRQITEPFTLTESVGLSPAEMTWRFEGAGPAGIPGTWTNEQKTYISSELGIPVADISMLHVYQDLSSTRAEHMQSRVELVYANATVPLETDPEGRDAITILRLETNFTQLPPPVEDEFMPYLIGIAAEESRFDANKTSKAGAVGILQTMPATFEGYWGEELLANRDPRNLVDQLPASINHIETSYLELQKNLEIELAHITQFYFDGNRASMEKYFLVPVMINSYNAGQQRMIEVVRWFFSTYPDPESVAELLGQDEPPSGYDLFFVMTYQCAKEKAVARFGPEASVYVEKVMGWETAVKDYENKQKKIRIASNN
jgi:hypothetical protein